jgi:hypothetical protein
MCDLSLLWVFRRVVRCTRAGTAKDIERSTDRLLEAGFDQQFASGPKYELFGPNAKGIVIFDRNGTYSFQIMRAARPSFVAESRLEGTTEENKAAVQGMISHFGTYEVDEASRSIIFCIEGSSYPNWDSTEQKRSFTLLGNQLSWSDPAAGPHDPAICNLT